MLNNSKSKMKILSVTLVLILMTLMAAVFLCNTPTATAEEFKPSNFVTARKTGTLNGTLQKQPDGSVTFNGEMIASAEENLSQMYVILQGAGGAGGNRVYSLLNNSNGGGAGAFALVLIKFKAFSDSNGNTFYLPVNISSGSGGKMKTYPSGNLYKEGDNSIISIKDIGSITATSGSSANTSKGYLVPGGKVEINPIIDNMSEYMEVTYQQDGKTSNKNHTSNIFTINMYKNGGWLTTRTFNTHLGGMHNRGGGASPYSKGGDGVYYDFALIWDYPESAPSYGAGGGGSFPYVFNAPEDSRCDMSKFGTGGDGGDGFIEILG